MKRCQVLQNRPCGNISSEESSRMNSLSAVWRPGTRQGKAENTTAPRRCWPALTPCWPITKKVELPGSHTREAKEDLERLYAFLLEHDIGSARRAKDAIAKAMKFLEDFPFACRKSSTDNPFLPFSGKCLFLLAIVGMLHFLRSRTQRLSPYWPYGISAKRIIIDDGAVKPQVCCVECICEKNCKQVFTYDPLTISGPFRPVPVHAGGENRSGSGTSSLLPPQFNLFLKMAK